MILTAWRALPATAAPEERRLGRMNLSTTRRDYEEAHPAAWARRSRRRSAAWETVRVAP